MTNLVADIVRGLHPDSTHENIRDAVHMREEGRVDRAPRTRERFQRGNWGDVADYAVDGSHY